MTDPAARVTRSSFLSGCATCAAIALLDGLPTGARADSHDQERQIGQQVWNQLKGQNQIVERSAYYPVLREIGGRISDAAQPHWYAMNFVVVTGQQANAFSVPGGNVYVNEALLKAAENDDELAGVLGHETGHLVLGHVMTRIQRAQLYNIGLNVLGIFVRSPMAATVTDLVANYSFLNFSRQQEYQADHEGAILAARAGYNPWGEIWFFRKLKKLYGDTGFEQYVEDHPSTDDRIARLKSFYASAPATFARWHDLMPSPSNGLATSGANIDLVLKPN